MGRIARRLVPLLTAIGILFAAPDWAGAEQRFVAPAGVPMGACAAANPCRIDYAVNLADDGDEVIVAAGDYNVTATPLSTLKGITVRGADPGIPPSIVSGSAADATLSLGAGSTATGLRLTNVGGGAYGALAIGTGSTVERVFALSGGSGSIVACGSTIRDSVAIDNGPSGAAVYLHGPGASTIVNVTAIGSAAGTFGIVVRPLASGQSATAVIRNTIARGVEKDLIAQSNDSSTLAEIEIDYSNYRPSAVNSLGEGQEVFTPGPHNQDAAVAAPLLIDAATGDVHQLPGSPTIDAGLQSAAVGSLDFEGQPRPQGAAVDIGADELAVAVPIVAKAPPRLSKLRLKRRAFRVKTGAKKKRGTAFSFNLDAAASVRVTIRRVVKRRGKTSFPRVGTLLRAGAAGANSIAFSGRVKGRPLSPGRYRADLVATNAGGASGLASARFRVLAP